MKFDVEYKMCYTYNLPVIADKRQDVVDEADNIFKRLLKDCCEGNYKIDSTRYITKIKEVR